MKFDIGTRRTGWLKEMLHGILQPSQDAAAAGQRIGQLTRQGLSVVLSALMILIPMGAGEAFGQSIPPVAADDQQVSQGEPLSPGQLDQLVAPIALYPDALLAQVLAAATYPTQVVEADRWRQAQGNAPAEQIAAGAENNDWDPSVKALTGVSDGTGADGPEPAVDNGPGQCLLQPTARRDGFSAGDAPEGRDYRSVAQYATAGGNQR
jgi:hypothetical protein